MAISKIGRNATDTSISDSGDATAITIDSSERVTMPSQPMMFAIRTGTRMIAAASNAQVIIPFTEQLDVGNDFASNVFTCPVDGKYFVSFYGLVLNASADGYSSVNIRVNSTNTLTAYQGSTTAQGNEIACSGIVSVSANDTISCFFDGGSTNSKLHEDRFGGFTVQLIA